MTKCVVAERYGGPAPSGPVVEAPPRGHRCTAWHLLTNSNVGTDDTGLIDGGRAGRDAVRLELIKLAEVGGLRVFADKVFTLADAADGHRHLRPGTRTAKSYGSPSLTPMTSQRGAERIAK